MRFTGSGTVWYNYCTMSKFLNKNWPLIGVALLVLIVALYLGRSRKEVVKKHILSDLVSSEGVKLEDIHFTHESAGEGVKWAMDAREVKISEDGQRISFTSFRLRLEPPNRPVVHLEGREGRYDKATGEIHLRGDLRGRTEDGYTFSTESAVYSQKEGRLATDAPVSITGPLFSLEGVGLTYNVAEEKLAINAKVSTMISGKWITS